MTAEEIFLQASKLGLRLKPIGDKLAVIPGNRCPPDFADKLHQHKGELLAMLAAETSNLATDIDPWLHVARQVLAGEFKGADRSTRESLTIGLQSISDPVARRALETLR